MLRPGFAALLIVCSVAAVGCSTWRDQLARGQRAFDQNEHDRAITVLRDLEPDFVRLSPAEQAQYAYVRGMSDYRVGYQADARHWLALAKAYEEGSPGALPADWKARTTEALNELNAIVYSDGYQALKTTHREESETPAGAAPEASESNEEPAPSKAKSKSP